MCTFYCIIGCMRKQRLNGLAWSHVYACMYAQQVARCTHESLSKGSSFGPQTNMLSYPVSFTEKHQISMWRQ